MTFARLPSQAPQFDATALAKALKLTDAQTKQNVADHLRVGGFRGSLTVSERRKHRVFRIVGAAGGSRSAMSVDGGTIPHDGQPTSARRGCRSESSVPAGTRRYRTIVADPGPMRDLGWNEKVVAEALRLFVPETSAAHASFDELVLAHTRQEATLREILEVVVDEDATGVAEIASLARSVLTGVRSDG